MAGAQRNGGDDEEMISGINVTPLVDITLVLLIIFMVTATKIVQTKSAIEVELPRAAHGGESVGVMLNIVITKEPKLFVDGVETDEDGLKRKVAEALDRDKEARAIISADKSSLHGEVVHVIDVIKGQGIAKFAINIEKEEAAHK